MTIYNADQPVRSFGAPGWLATLPIRIAISRMDGNKPDETTAGGISTHTHTHTSLLIQRLMEATMSELHFVRNCIILALLLLQRSV